MNPITKDIDAAPPVGSGVIRSVLSREEEPRPQRTLRTYWRLQPGRWWEWAAVWLLQNIRFAPIYLLPLMTGKLIDTANRDDSDRVFTLIPWFAAATIGLCIFNVLGDTGAKILLSRISRSLTLSLRAALLRRLNRLAFSFHDRERMGELQGKFTIDLQRLEGFQAFLADGILMNATVILVMLAITMATNPLLVVIVMVGVALNLALVTIIWRRLHGAQEAYRNAEGTFLNRLGETLRGLRLVRAHAAETFTEERLRRDAKEVAHKGILLDFMVNLFGSSSWAINTMLGTAVIALGVCLVVASPHAWSVLGMRLRLRPITVGELTVLLSYYGIVTGAVTSMVAHAPTVAGAGSAIGSLSRLYRGEDEHSDGTRQVEEIAGAIRLEAVRFAYPTSDDLIIDGIDLDIPAGSSVALVGQSGSGKSTLASLILGFYRPQSGSISIDGIPMQELDLRSLRRHVGLVSQEIVLFSDTIVSNIAWGDHNADERLARRAAELANAGEFIDRFPEGMHHVLGDGGSGLSGGQRQRLAIARAIYRDPRILVLDEATSALDSESERQVQVALGSAMAQRTTIVIAHRLSTIRSVDRIVVIEHGRVVESGSYGALMDAGGPFRRLVGDIAQVQMVVAGSA